MRSRATSAFAASITLLWATFSIGPASAMPPQRVASAAQACHAAKARYAAHYRVSVGAIALCDIILQSASPKGFYILALHGRRDCDGICSTNLGWFAIEKATGRVFETSVEDWKPGKPL